MLVAAALAAWLLAGSGLPAFSDNVVLRSGLVGGEGMLGMLFGADYVHTQAGHMPIIVSLDEGVNLNALFAWGTDTTGDTDEFTSLLVSHPVAAGSPVLIGAGLIRASRWEQNKLTQPALRLTLTTNPSKLLVGQVRLTSVAALGVITDLSLGIGF